MAAKTRHAMRGAAAHAKRDGFTFMEVMLVALILAVLVTATVPQFARTLSRMRAEHTATEFAQLMRFANNLSVMQRREVVWAWDDAAGRAALQYAAEDDTREAVKDRRAAGDSVAREINVSVLDPAGAPITEVRFYPDGTAEEAYAIAAFEQKAYTAHVDPVTAQVSVEPGRPSF